jgi:hypothetical protein
VKRQKPPSSAAAPATRRATANACR